MTLQPGVLVYVAVTDLGANNYYDLVRLEQGFVIQISHNKHFASVRTFYFDLAAVETWISVDKLVPVNYTEDRRV